VTDAGQYHCIVDDVPSSSNPTLTVTGRAYTSKVVSPEISGNLFQSFRIFTPEAIKWSAALFLKNNE